MSIDSKKMLKKLRGSIQPKAKSKPKPAETTKAAKLSISLHPADLAAVNAIQLYMMQQGYTVPTSAAIKLALRSVNPSPALVEIYQTISAEDGRRK